MALRKTNVQFVKHMMEFSDHGALAQIFIMDALEKQSKEVAETPIEELRIAFGEFSFVSADSWQSVAKEIQEKLKANI